MAPTNPLDAALRAYLSAHTKNQGTLAAAIGRDRTWLNRYIHGSNAAALDDVILMLAAFIRDKRGIGDTLTDAERRLLKLFRALPDDDRREDVIGLTEGFGRRKRQSPPPPREATAPSAHTPSVATRKARGRPRTSEG